MRSCLLLTLLLAGPAAAQPVVYVRPGATGAADGSSWADAFPDLQMALQAAVPPAEVWVAAGTYRPTTGTDRTATFQLRSGVALYGGFAGTEATREARDPAANVTTLSGEIGSPTTPNDNSYHVVTGSGVDTTAVLDGFTVTGGRANGTGAATDPLRIGAGMYNVAGSPTVRNALFRGNAAAAGSGVWNGEGSDGRFERVRFEGGPLMGPQVYNRGSAPTVTDAIFEGTVTVGSGGGMANEGSSPRLTRVAFRGNTAANGGAMLNWRGSHPVCIDCTFENNTAHPENGGAVFNEESAPLFIRATFVGNTSTSGGGALWNEEVGADMACVGCLFRGNTSALGYGGAAYLSLFDRPTFINTVFEGNAAPSGGGGAVVTSSGTVATFVNVAFVGNRAESGGAATFLTGTRRLVGVTIAGNRARDGGGALEIAGGSTVLLNAVVWGNALLDGSPSGVLHTAGGVTVRHGILQGGCAPPMACEAVVDADPLFVRAPEWAGGTLVDAGDLRLRAGSPALDAGLASYLPADAWDLDGDGDTEEPLPVDLLWMPRVSGAGVDLGAYEGDVVVAAEPEPERGGVALSVVPNPVRSAGTITVTTARTANARVAVYDVLGRTVAVLYAGPLGAGAHALGVPPLPAGAYVVRATAGEAAAAARLVVAR